MVFQYDHYPGAIVNSFIGYSSWSEKEKGRQGYRCTQYKPTKVSLLGVSRYYSIVKVFDLKESCPVLNAIAHQYQCPCEQVNGQQARWVSRALQYSSPEPATVHPGHYRHHQHATNHQHRHLVKVFLSSSRAATSVVWLNKHNQKLPPSSSKLTPCG